jgi:pimeloyl-ACP methyl ester carboxylesterase
MFELQSHFIFPTHAVAPAGPLPAGARSLELEAGGGVTLHGVAFPAERDAKERVLVLGFAGNAWNAQDAGSYLAELYPDCEIVAFHYRGYYPSGGSPSSDGLVADAPLLYDFAIEHFAHDRVIAVGFSIGCGIAAKLSAERKLDGVILVTPFDSLKAAAQSLYPWLPIGAFFRHDIDAAEALERSRVPTAIVAAANDDIIVPDRTNALRRRLKSLAFDATIPRAGHNDIYARSDFHGAMRKALDALIG